MVSRRQLGARATLAPTLSPTLTLTLTLMAGIVAAARGLSLQPSIHRRMPAPPQPRTPTPASPPPPLRQPTPTSQPTLTIQPTPIAQPPPLSQPTPTSQPTQIAQPPPLSQPSPTSQLPSLSQPPPRVLRSPPRPGQHLRKRGLGSVRLLTGEPFLTVEPFLTLGRFRMVASSLIALRRTCHPPRWSLLLLRLCLPPMATLDMPVTISWTRTSTQQPPRHQRRQIRSRRRQIRSRRRQIRSRSARSLARQRPHHLQLAALLGLSNRVTSSSWAMTCGR